MCNAGAAQAELHSGTVLFQRSEFMVVRLAIVAAAALVLSGCQQTAPVPTTDASVGVGNPYPVSEYTCEDGTSLAVQLMGESASVSANGEAAVDLPSVGSDGTTFSDGQQTLTIVQGQVSWGVGSAAPTSCTGG
jgi:hypothetical protein